MTAFARDVLEGRSSAWQGLKAVDAGSKQSGTDQPENAVYRDGLIVVCSLSFAGATKMTKVMPSDVSLHHAYGPAFFETIT